MPRTEVPWYPEPGPDLLKADEDQVVRWIGGWLMDAAPAGWQRIDMTARLASILEETSTGVVMPDGDVAEMELPPDISPLLYQLRQKKYMLDRGTWLSMRLTIEPTGDYRVLYNFDTDPRWDPPLEAHVFDHEFDSFPRDEEWIPAWYREGIKGGTGGTRTPNEPNALLASVRNELEFSLPAGWERVQVQYHALGDHEESAAVIHPVTGADYPWTLPKHVLDLLRQHRAASLSDDRGTWVSLKYEMSFPRSVKAQFTSNEDPGFRQQPPAEAYAEELRLYPRSAKHTPDWLRRGAEGA